jgi:hypothetical protein
LTVDSHADGDGVADFAFGGGRNFDSEVAEVDVEFGFDLEDVAFEPCALGGRAFFEVLDFDIGFDRLGDTMHGEFPRDGIGVAFDELDGCCFKRDGFELCGVEPVRAAHVLVAEVDSGVDAGGIDDDFAGASALGGVEFEVTGDFVGAPGEGFEVSSGFDLGDLLSLVSGSDFEINRSGVCGAKSGKGEEGCDDFVEMFHGLVPVVSQKELPLSKRYVLKSSSVVLL